MEEITLQPRTFTNGLKGPNRDYRPVSFEGEHVVSVDPSGHDDTSGTKWEVYRTEPKPEDEQEKIIVFVKPWSRWEGTTCTSYVVVYHSVSDFLNDSPDMVVPDQEYGVDIPDFVRAQAEEELGLDSAIRV